MINRILGNGCYELVQSKDECCYQDVLDDFPNVTEIYILTYNISRRNDELLELLDDLNEDVSISLITNIPSRFQSYRGDNSRRRARGNISIYLSRLDPERYSTSISTFFHFSNHSKIIMTNNIAYIGSANYSSESSDSFECGFITRDTSVINEVRDNFFRRVQEESVRYYGNQLTRLEVLFMSFYSRIETLSNNIFEGVIWVDDDGQHHYNSIDSYVRWDDVEGLEELIAEFCDIQNAWEDNELFQELVLGVDVSSIRNIVRICREENDLYELANFDDQNYMDDYLEDNAMEAYDEHLNDYTQKASENAAEVRQDLAESAEDIVVELYDNIILFQRQLQQILEHIAELKEQDTIIDNT